MYIIVCPNDNLIEGDLKMKQVIKEPIVEQCKVGPNEGKSCSKICSDFITPVCEAYISPKAKWKLGNCALASHLFVEPKKKGVGLKRKFGSRTR